MCSYKDTFDLFCSKHWENNTNPVIMWIVFNYIKRKNIQHRNQSDKILIIALRLLSLIYFQGNLLATLLNVR